MENISYDVPVIPQPDKLSCWAASMAMMVGYSRKISISPETLAEEVGRSLRTCYDWDMLESVRDHFGFQTIELPSNASLYLSPEQWRDWLASFGPLWVTTVGAPTHAIVVKGISGDLTPENTQISIDNPWNVQTAFSDDEIDFDPANDGLEETKSFADFAADFGNIDQADYGSWRVLYLPAAMPARADESSESSASPEDSGNPGSEGPGSADGAAPQDQPEEVQ
jgi:hypothetical protein